MALVACLDIALNPSVPPLCPPQSVTWRSLYPPERFLAAVGAIAGVGLPDLWLTNGDYRFYRRKISNICGLDTGSLVATSCQNEAFSEDYFHTVEQDDPVLAAMSYFDYYIWASEQLHALRTHFPLTMAWPWLINHKHSDGPDCGELLAQSWIFAPLIWVGDELHNEGHLSLALVVRLTLDLMVWNALRSLATASSRVIDLRSLFPPEAMQYVSRGDLVLRALAGDLGCPSIRSWRFVCDTEVPQLVRSPQRHRSRRSKPSVEYVTLDRSSVEAQDFTQWNDLLERLRAEPIRYAGSVDLLFNGYASDPREIWEIPEVRWYCRELRQRAPDWAWYCHISPEFGECPGFFMLATAHCDHPTEPALDELEQFVNDAFESLNAEASRVGAPEPLVDKLSADLARLVKNVLKNVRYEVRREFLIGCVGRAPTYKRAADTSSQPCVGQSHHGRRTLDPQTLSTGPFLKARFRPYGLLALNWEREPPGSRLRVYQRGQGSRHRCRCLDGCNERKP